MLEPFRDAEGYRDVLDQVTALLGFDPLDPANRALIATNKASSLLTVAASVLAMERVAEMGAPVGVAGYSVGQWTALHAAGAFDRADLFALVEARARLMDEALAGGDAGGMLGVIGVPRAALALICEAASTAGHVLEIANENAPGQFTLSGDMPGLALAENRLLALSPRRVSRLAVAGAWHSSLLRPAVAPLAALISATRLEPARLPVVDNVTGAWLPSLPPPGRLAEQVASPVLWMQGLATLARAGACTFVEVGYGATLSQFGFFAERDARHVPIAPPQRRAA
jgi:[acyl-carrier-protein] S-malonyltransferase